MPKTSYYQGVPRDYTKLDKLSFAWPTFEHIGEQNVLNQEIMWNHPQKKDTFGYIPRYAEYKYIPNRVHGDFTDSLDFWHLSRKFPSNAPPNLNSTFIECNPRTDIFAVQETEFANILVNIYTIIFDEFFPIYPKNSIRYIEIMCIYIDFEEHLS